MVCGAGRPISAAEVKAIFATMRKILTTTIERKDRGDDYPPRYLIHHREEGARCPRCGGASGNACTPKG